MLKEKYMKQDIVIILFLLFNSIVVGAQALDDELIKDMKIIPISNTKLVEINNRLRLIDSLFIYFRPEFYVVNHYKDHYFDANRANCHEVGKHNCREVFVYNESKGFLKQLTDERFSEICGKFVFKNNLFYLFDRGTEKKLISGILLIPESSPYSYKLFEFRDPSYTWTEDVKVVDGNLQIGVEVRDTHLQWEYYVLFFLPRERPAKWGHDKIYKYNYTFDKDLNLISKKLVKTYKK